MAGPTMRLKQARFLLILMLFSLASCRSTERSPVASGPPPGSGSVQPNSRSSELYVEVCALTQLPYFIDHRLGMEAAGRELGVRAEFVGPADYDISAMITTLEQTLARQPAGILVVGFDVGLKPAIDRAVESGVPVI